MKRVDIKGGQMTFSQRIELGKILSDQESSEPDKYRAIMTCLDPNWHFSVSEKSIEYCGEVMAGILYWIDREQRELKYNPTIEEIAAGVQSFSLNVGEMSTIMAIAEKFSKDPDEVIEWKYGKVFNILYVNLQSHLFRKRYDEVIRKKHEQKRGRR